MSRNIVKFIRDDVYGWMLDNVREESKSFFPTKKDFWIDPVARDDPAHSAIEAGLKDRFKTTKFSGWSEIDGLGLAVMKEGERVFACGVYKDGRRNIAVSAALDGVEQYTDMSFLQQMEFLSTLSAKAREAISPRIWDSSPILEADIANYFPGIVCFEFVNAPQEDTDYARLLKFLLSLELGAENAKSFQTELISVMFSMPTVGHDWLAPQLLSAVLSGRDSNFFGELYKLAEFFFPMSKISGLKERIGYTGSNLELLSICRNVLGWHVNHQLGSRLAVNYADVRFAEVMLGKTFLSSNGKEGERKFKEEAMEEITAVRHALIHQNYEDNSPPPDILVKATKSLLIFLESSFAKYNVELGDGKG